MQTRSLLLPLCLLSVCACGSTGGDPASSTSESSFSPPAVEQGYTRITAKTVQGVKPGEDVTYCQYVMAPLDHDVDVLSVGGYQSKFGHHAVAMTYKPQDGEQPGSSFPCMGTEFNAGGPDGGAPNGGSLSQGTFLGGAGGEQGGKSASSLPDGVAVRLPKGYGVMLNLHYINTGDVPIDGDAVVDLQFADPDPSRKLAALFVNLNIGFQLPPMAPTTSTVDCVAKSDVSLIMMSNHMHEWGTSVSSQVIHADGSVEDLHDDPSWSFDMQFNPVYSRWPVEAPFVLKAGDTLRTTCNWNNTTSNPLQFPREMCLGVGFALVSADKPTAPSCAQGTWMDSGM